MLRSLSAVFVLFLSLSVAAGEAPAVYLQASEVNLRAKPSRRGRIVGQVRIATRCALLKQAKGGWVQVRCGDKTGFTLGAFFDQIAPTFEAMMARSHDRSLAAEERFDAALRADALKPGQEEALLAVRDRYLDVEFGNLAQARQDPNNKLRIREYPCQRGNDTVCLEAGLGEIAHDWFQIYYREDDFLAVFYWRERLYLVGGSFFTPAGKLRVEAALTKSYKANQTLLGTLKSAAKHAERQTVYPIDPQSLAVLRKLPVDWYVLRGLPTDPHYWGDCNYTLFELSRHFQFVEDGLVTQAKFNEDQVQDSAEFAILSAQRRGRRYDLTIRQVHPFIGKDASLQIDFPLEGALLHASRWTEGKWVNHFGAWSGDQTERKQQYPIREPKNCPEEDREDH